jgi:ubiquinone/menaquinone biosynthesis C-methylase UbiE
MENIQVFEKYVKEYDEWYEENRFAYESEIQAIKKLIPKDGNGLEVGVGTGRFAVPFGIWIGVEPAKAMAEIARKRGIEVYDAKGEKLPFDDDSFDFVLMVTVICFLENPVQALEEANRVIKSGGHIIIGMIDKNSPLGKIYESKKDESKFYKYAHFYSVNHVLEWLKKIQFSNIETSQTIFKNPKEITTVEPVKEGYSEGGFVVISAQKKKGNKA